MSVTLHTTAGDLKTELFCERCPKACENFLALCASGYYNNCIFHRNIKSFMVQTGDPTNTGKGGQSIWNAPFEDELHTDITHDSRGFLSMASNGPNTNRSQFFITYEKQAHLDLKHTVFGRVIDGFDTLEELENIKVDAKYRPVVEQRIRNVTIHANPIAILADTSESRQ
jgi:peptidyl-prolyl cis-trans isomerase-like 3